MKKTRTAPFVLTLESGGRGTVNLPVDRGKRPIDPETCLKIVKNAGIQIEWVKSICRKGSKAKGQHPIPIPWAAAA